MGLNAFTSMVGQLTKFDMADRVTKTVGKEDYEIFCKEFIFDALKEHSFAEAFCKRFNIDDPILPRLSDDGARFIIESVGYIEE